MLIQILILFYQLFFINKFGYSSSVTTIMAVLSLRSLPFFSCLHVIIILLSKTSGQVIDRYFCDKQNDRGNYTTNSTYDTNLKTLLSTITSNTESNNFGFYNLSYGQDTDKVYAIGMCRADIKTYTCNTCLNKARLNLRQVCQNRKEAIGWYEDETCMLRYSDRLILYVMEIGPAYYASNHHNATSMDEFNGDVKTLMTRLTSEAASGNSSLKYATGNKDGPNDQTIYGLVQCTPDMSGSQCSSCLNESISQLAEVSKNRIGARQVRPSCILRYEINSTFYNPYQQDAPPTTPETNSTFNNTEPDAPPPTTPPPTPGKSNTLLIYIVVAVAVVVLSFILISFILWKRRKRFQTELDSEIEPVETLQFTFETIRVATNNFSEANMLGKGGFGPVYKGKLSNGQEIAVKRLSMNSAQGDTEFKNEVQLVAKLQHRNLVRLFGFSLEKRERLLVYEFVPNKSLDYFIFDPIKRVNLDWETRYKIIGGIAKGLLYLHEDSRLRIIHRDLKASNILLDAEMNSKISDFGMARLIVMDQTQGNTNRVVGTYGYMAPEYVMQGQFSVKSDVFSFGVLALEIVCGQKNSNFLNGEHEEDLLSFAWKNWKDGKASNMIDPTINNGLRHEIMRCIHIGLLCVQENLAERPTMASVVLMLNSYSTTLPVPLEPAFFMQSRAMSDIPSWDYNSTAVESTYPNEGEIAGKMGSNRKMESFLFDETAHIFWYQKEENRECIYQGHLTVPSDNERQLNKVLRDLDQLKA